MVPLSNYIVSISTRTYAGRDWVDACSRRVWIGLASRGRGRVELWSDTRFEDAHRLYERLGYVKTDTRELDDVNDTVEFKYERDYGR